jgi:hypothetical protein
MLNFSSKGLKVNSKQADVIGTVKGLTRVSGWSESVTTDPVPPGEVRFHWPNPYYKNSSREDTHHAHP